MLHKLVMIQQTEISESRKNKILILFFADTRKAPSNSKDTRKDASNPKHRKRPHPAQKEAQKEHTTK